MLLTLPACPHGRASSTLAGPSRDPLELELIPSPLHASPQLALGGEYLQILFHLNLRNVSPRALRLRRVEVRALRGSEVLSVLALEEALLRRRLRPVPWIVMHDPQSIAAAHRFQGQMRRAMGDTLIGPGRGASLTHQLAVERADTRPDRIRITVTHDGGDLEREFPVLLHAQRTRLRLPVEGRWWVIAGHRFDEPHASAILASQNFAYDLGVVGANLATAEGDPRENSSYHAHGRPIVAAADGRVVRMRDRVEENSPVGRRPTWTEILRDAEGLAGNYVVLEHEGGEHTAYLHLMPGMRVRLGDRVKVGQVIGACGNSGNSLEAHLHVQLQDGPDPLRAAGWPARFGDFTIHMAHLRLYVPPTDPRPLPVNLWVEPGRSAGAVDLSTALRGH